MDREKSGREIGKPVNSSSMSTQLFFAFLDYATSTRIYCAVIHAFTSEHNGNVSARTSTCNRTNAFPQTRARDGFRDWCF